MTQVERDAICQSILAMSEDEHCVVLDCIPTQLMLDHISMKLSQQDLFIENVKQAMRDVI